MSRSKESSQSSSQSRKTMEKEEEGLAPLSDSFSGRRKLFWGNDDHLKSRAALSFQLDLLVLQQQYSCAIWTLRRNYRGISLDETLLESSLREKAEWKLSKSPKCSGLLSVSHQWKKTAIYGGLIPQSAPSYTLIHKNTVFSKLKFNLF